MIRIDLVLRICNRGENVDLEMAASIAASAAAAVSPSPAAGYFVDTKKGEVNELKNVRSYMRVCVCADVDCDTDCTLV